MTYSEIRKNEEVLAFIKKGNANLGAMGFTDHSEAHSGLVAERAAEILKKFGYPEKDIELVKIAGFMHDIGNAVNRSHHAEYGALLANDILKKTDLPLEDRVQIVSAIGLHDESTGGATDPISAALIIADKTDVIRAAATSLGTFNLSGCEIYTSCEPCPMCLGAIYWARLDKMYYGNNKTDAKNIGFDDSFIYDEIALKPADRKLPSEVLLHNEAIKAFEAWAEKEDKIEY